MTAEPQDSDQTTPVVDSVETLDRLIEGGYVPPGWRTAPHPFDACFLAASPLQTRLRRLLQLYGAHPKTDQFFASTKDYAASAIGRNPLMYLTKHAQTLAQINAEQQGIFAHGAVQHFLDLGCSPGGFSSWTLRHNPDATGIGIAVPDHESRWRMVVEGTHLAEPRYELRYQNIANFVRGFVDRGERPVVAPEQLPVETTPKSFDFVLAGYTPMVGPITWREDALHLLSKILILLSNIKPGGHAVVMTSTKTFRWIVEVMRILRHCFATMASSKGVQLYSQRSACFLVCRSFCATDEQVAEYTEVLRSALMRLWAAIEAGDGEADKGEGGEVTETEKTEDGGEETHGEVPPKFELRLFEDLSDDEIFEAEFPYVLGLFEPAWQIQFDSVYRGFVKSLAGEDLEADRHSPTSPTSTSWRTRPARIQTADQPREEGEGWSKVVSGSAPSSTGALPWSAGSQSSGASALSWGPASPSGTSAFSWGPASPSGTGAFSWVAKPPSPIQSRGKWQVPARRASASSGDSGFGSSWRTRSGSQCEGGAPKFDMKKPTGAADGSSSWRSRA